MAVFCPDISRMDIIEKTLAWMNPDCRLQILPDWETLPYDRFSPHKDLIAHRIKALTQLLKRECDVVLISMVSAMTRLSARSYFTARMFHVQVGASFSRESFNHQLAESGYHIVSQVLSPGEWALRGGIIDLFPMGATLPCRIELLDDKVESLRLFDPETQRTLYPIPALEMLPAREFPFDEDAINRFRRSFREHYQGNYAAHPLYKQVSGGSLFAGAEYFLPWWSEGVSHLFDYLPDNTVTLLIEGDWEPACQQFWKQVEETYESHRHDPEFLLLPPSEIFVPPAEFLQHLSKLSRITINVQTPDSNILPLPSWLTQPPLTLSPIERLRQWSIQESHPLLLFAESAGRRNVLEDQLNQGQLPYQTGSVAEALSHFAEAKNTSSIWLTTARLEQGFITPATPALPALAWVGEDDLFYRQGTRRSSKSSKSGSQRVEQWIRDLSELQIGDPVVHQQYGIGRYRGLVHLEGNEGDNEFLQLEYAHDAKLYVPVTQLHVIGRYASTGEHQEVRLHALGTQDWEKARQKAEKLVRDTAAELLSLYALRQTQQGVWMTAPPMSMNIFADEFGFELTADQDSAIMAVLSDMAGQSVMGLPNIADIPPSFSKTASPQANINDETPVTLPRKPMDRLVCGDVGFGKTEVALRAAFVALMSGYQVAILCPTTLLAEQHTQTFQDRFARFLERLRHMDIDHLVDQERTWINAIKNKPINIVGLSRFRTSAEQKAMVTHIAEGSVDIVIGTHRLLQKDVAFKRLGLVIIDEEHRFGVRHKESLKTLRAQSHILTLTATPIPRTLSLSIEGLREFSVMTTPPSRRLAVKTMLTAFQDGMVREAVQRELRRGGQVFFLYNEVSTIQTMRDRLQTLIPQARIAIAHGQMGELALERVMRDFRHQQFNILLCTTIIENGIDIPNANTILIHRADHFGIAQLHQLRGRVGRSHHQAYCYLLVDRPESLSKIAQQRLDAICASEELGAGFYLAMHDLEIRGAGEWLGENQSGAMAQVGFDLYSQMLAQAVKTLKQGKNTQDETPFTHPEEINLHCSAHLPEDYCHDVHERLKIYKRLASADHADALTELRAEIVDRFGLTRDGKLPIAVETLLSVHRLRVRARPLGIYKITATADTVQLFFHHQTPLTPTTLISLLRSHKNWSMKGSDRLLIQSSSITPHERVERVMEALQAIERVIV